MSVQKEFQLWVWYANQNADNPQNGYELSQFDTPEDMFKAVLKLGKDDSYFTTRKVCLKVQAV